MKTNGMSGEDCATVIKLTDDAGVPAEGATAQPTPRWPLVNLRLLRRHFKEAETENPKEQHKGSILTTSEEKDLVAILQKAHDDKDGKDRKEIRLLVADALKLRRRQNNKHSGSFRKNAAPLTTKAIHVLNSGGMLPSDRWFREFYARHPGLNEGGAITDDVDRVDAVSEQSAVRHIKCLMDEAMTVPEAIAIKVPLEDATALLGALKLADADVLPEAKNHAMSKPVLPVESFTLLPGGSLPPPANPSTHCVDNPVWLCHVENIFLGVASSVDMVIDKLNGMTGDVDCNLQTSRRWDSRRSRCSSRSRIL